MPKRKVDLVSKSNAELTLSLVWEIIENTRVSAWIMVIKEANKSVVGKKLIFKESTENHKEMSLSWLIKELNSCI